MSDILEDVLSIPLKCNGCTACCRGREALFIMPEFGDDPAAYVTVEDTDPRTGKPVRRIPNKENGDCHYLDREKGCTIYDRRPAICSGFDCRGALMLLMRRPKGERRRMAHAGMIDPETVKAGMSRLKDAAHALNRKVREGKVV